MKNKYLKVFLILVILVNINACFKWEVIPKLDSLSESQRNDLINVKAEIIFENEVYKMIALFYEPECRSTKYIFSGCVKSNEAKKISVSVKTDDPKNLNLFTKFRAESIFIINKVNNYYIEYNKITLGGNNFYIQYIYDKSSTYIPLKDDYVVIKLVSNEKTIYMKNKLELI